MSFTGSVAGQSLTTIAQGSVSVVNNTLYFPGITGSYLNLGVNSPVHFNTSTSNLFVEAWVNFSQNAYTEYIAGTLYSTTTDDWGFRVDGTFNRFMFYHYNTSGVSTAVTAPSGTPVIQGTWYHVAASFTTTGIIYLYVNGVLQNAGGTSIGGTPRYTAAASAFIGTPSPLPSGWVATSGYFRDVRIIKDGIVPTTTFTPDPTPWYYQTIPSYVTGGTNVFGLYGQYMGVRTQMTGATSGGGSGTPVDLSPSPATIPSATVTQSGPVSGEGALSFSGTGIQMNGSKFPFNWYTGFTIEAWVKYTSFTNALAASVAPVAVGVMQTSGNIDDWSFGPNTSGQLQFYYYFTGQNTKASSNTITAGTWTHICAQHDGTNFHMYINGVRCLGPVSITGTVSLSSSHSYLSIGQYYNSTGPTFSIADVRLVQGSNVYPVTGFTAPTSKLTVAPVGTTVFLLQVPLGTLPIQLTRTLGMLDAISTVPSAAFSLRRLYRSWTSPVVQVRRQSDLLSNTFVADIYGNLSNVQNGTTLQTFLNATTGNVTTWYDQSGNGRHATGTLITITQTSNVNQQWALNPTNGGLTVPGGTFLNGTDFTIACTTKRLGTQGNDGVYGYGANASWVSQASVPTTYGDNTRFALVMPNSGSTSVAFNDSSYSAAFSSNANVLPSSFVAATEPVVYTAVTLTNANQQMYINGTANGLPISTLTQVTANASTSFTIGAVNYYGNFLGEIGELIIFNTALGASDISTLYSAR
jgi:Concanavalin A-like lectin/glucanases superfamily